MEKKIENPKVFISYAWSSKEYQEKVMNFAIRLQSDGIEVLIDKWIMKPSSDTIDFMEQCVKDSSVNFVLMLLDKKYAEKADSREGGVGIETQIISNEVYNDVKQNKFIPIIFDRDKSGTIYKPTYLKNRFHYDFTMENYEDEYVKLVKQIYGREIYYKPPKGNKPSWIDEADTSEGRLKFAVSQSGKNEKLLDFLLLEIKDTKFEQLPRSDDENENAKNNLKVYGEYIQYRNILIDIFIKQHDNEEFVDDVCDFYNDLKIWNRKNNGLGEEIWSSFIHETFIYLIAVLFKYRKYRSIYTFITKTYFYKNGREEITNSNTYFYYNDCNIIKASKKTLDGKNYYNPLAQLWIENIYEPKVNREEFVTADLLIYNLSILLLEEQRWYWFPVSYVYGSRFNHNGYLSSTGLKLKSKYELNRMKAMFGVDSIEEIKDIFLKMKSFEEENEKSYRYPAAFESADLFLDFIKVEEIGSVN
jgi:hypothetical protein